VEQAKGMVAEHEGVDMDAAFALLRRYSRGNNLRLSEVAGSVVSGGLAIATLTAGS
jgi:AmiR/NasT family two-component response regulator